MKDALNAENGKKLMGAPMSINFSRGGDRGSSYYYSFDLFDLF